MEACSMETCLLQEGDGSAVDTCCVADVGN
jgi:hypothetical protein